MAIATDLELYTGEGVDLAPGSDWAQFARDILPPHTGSIEAIRREQLASFGTFVGYMVVSETAIIDEAIAREVAGRFIGEMGRELVERASSEYKILNRGVDRGIHLGKIVALGNVRTLGDCA